MASAKKKAQPKLFTVVCEYDLMTEKEALKELLETDDSYTYGNEETLYMLKAIKVAKAPVIRRTITDL